VYRGYKFRSRLEARWAVYMDLCDIQWEYEPEGYELPSGRYLPDFYIPAYKSFLEVKPASFTIDPKSREIRLLEELVEGSLRGAVLVAGDPCEFKVYDTGPDPYVEAENQMRQEVRDSLDPYAHCSMLGVLTWVFEKVVGDLSLESFDRAFSSLDHYYEAARDFLTSHDYETINDGAMCKARWTDGYESGDGFLIYEQWVPFDDLGEPREVMTRLLTAWAARPSSLSRDLKKQRETHGLKARQARFEHGQSGAV
jgi:hypothetical protein